MGVQLTLAELRAEVEALGLEGGDIVNFVYKQEELYRYERAEERGARAAEAEAERAVQQLRLSVIQLRLRGRLNVRCVLQMH